MNESDFLSSDAIALEAEVPVSSSTARSPAGFLKSRAVSWFRNKSAGKNVPKESGSWVQISPVTFPGLHMMSGKTWVLDLKRLVQNKNILIFWPAETFHFYILLPAEIPKSAPFHPQKCPGLVDKLYSHLILKSALPIVYTYYIFFIHSSVDRYLGCFHVLAIVNSAAMNIAVCVLGIMVFSRYS